MKVSIITVCLNSVNTIEDAIKSVFLQDHKDIEYIVVDGRSTDATLDILEKYRRQISRSISEPDNGIYDAMNKGLELATGEVIAFLNADDFYAGIHVLSSVMKEFENIQVDAVYGDLVYVDPNDINNIIRCWKPGEYKKGKFRLGWVPPHPTFFCRREIYLKYGGYLDSFKIAADFELMLRLMEKYNIKTEYLPEVIVKMRTGGKANNIRGIIKGNMEIIKAFRLNQIHLSPLFFFVKPITKLRQLLIKQARPS
ncbi:MAG: glycosyltransferase family 2 protein [Planctomycetota bacterium]|jgi:glycosyltransferase involved in cell wall biosynthesis